MTTVWVDRRGAKPGPGATPAAEAAPDLTVSGMRELAELARGQRLGGGAQVSI